MRRSQSAATEELRMLRTLRETIEQPDNPIRKIADVCQQIGAETGKRDLRRCENQHHTEEKQIH